MKLLVFWRTALVVIFLALVLLAALLICAHWKLSDDFFGHAVTGCIGLATIVASKSAVEHLANGGGLLGMLKTLTTSAKPEGAPVPAPGPQQ